MPSYAGNVGTDYSFGYFDSTTNQLIDLGDVQKVKVTSQKKELKNEPYNGPPKFAYKGDGYKITFEIVRENADLEKILIARNIAFDAGALDRAGYLNETITNTDGSTTRNQYTGFVFWMDSLGEVSRDKLVVQSCEGMASTKINLS